jgi:hypothetical protein
MGVVIDVTKGQPHCVDVDGFFFLQDEKLLMTLLNCLFCWSNRNLKDTRCYQPYKLTLGLSQVLAFSSPSAMENREAISASHYLVDPPHQM